jgi:formylglycine-generating enzyme required for sulfatase activity
MDRVSVLIVLLSLAGGCARSGPCPADMAQIPGRTACIDRFEASLTGGGLGAPDGRSVAARAVSRRGVMPAVKINQLQAKAACANAGKRLCTRAEWVAACKGGTAARKYAYGDEKKPGLCHDRTLSQQRGSTAPLPTGSLEACRTPEGVYDMSGNVWEWLADGHPDGTTAQLMGAGYGNDDSFLKCDYERFAQPVTESRDAVGFRCCRDIAGGQ